jgi:hypothetical protein
MFKFHPVTSVGIHAPDGLFGHAVSCSILPNPRAAVRDRSSVLPNPRAGVGEREEKSWKTVRSRDRRRRFSSDKDLVTPNERK